MKTKIVEILDGVVMGEDEVQEAADQILALIEEIVPERKEAHLAHPDIDYGIFHGLENGVIAVNYGYGTYRSEFLRRLRGQDE